MDTTASRLPCIVNPQAPDNCTPILACDPPATYTCSSRGCVCLEPPAPTLACSFTVSYPANDPAQVLVTAPIDACAAGMEIALAALLARLLGGK